MYFFVTAAWLVTCSISWHYGNRGIPILVFLFGIAAQIGIWLVGIGFTGIAAIAILTVICMFTVPEIFGRS